MSHTENRRIIRKLKNSSVPFALLLCFFVALAALLIMPLAPALAWAAVLSFFTYPVYRFIHRRIFSGRYAYVAAAVNTGLILFLLVIPMIMAGVKATREVGKLYQFFIEWFPGTRELTLQQIMTLPQLQWLFAYFPVLRNLSIWSDLFSNITGTLATFMTQMSRELLGNAFRLGYNLLIITVASYFITLDGHIVIGFVRDILPLSGEAKEAFFQRANRMLHSIFYGIILTAMIQGLLGALGWHYVGLANPVFFGALMFFLAMLPFVGTPMVWIPGVIYLFLHGDARGAIILLAWGLLVVSTIDNFLRPFFISEGSKAHILLVFAGILGGLATWGFLGLFMGPLVLSVAFFLLQVYRVIVNIPLDEISFDKDKSEASPQDGEGSLK